jgi:DNA repair ATPase RecN
MGNSIYDLRKKIQETQAELNHLGTPVSEIPEMVDSANLIRSNEYLQKTNSKQNELLSTYEKYSGALEELLSTVFEIQNDLKDIVREQSSLLSKPKRVTSSKNKTKTTKK